MQIMRIPRVIFPLFVAALGFGGCVDVTHPKDGKPYYEVLTDLAPLESHYMRLGPMAVDSLTAPAPATLGRFCVWYPSAMRESKERYPVIISNNGTGVGASKYQEWFRRMATWGFIVIGNEEPTSWDGKSAQASLDWILNQNRSPRSIFYRHVDESNIGAVGHSQGGTGVENAVTVQPGKNRYKAAVMLASTYNGTNDFLRWEADASKIKIPIMILVSDVDALTPMKDYDSLWAAIPSTLPKVAARRLGCGHAEMLVYADGYVTAWFLAYLKGDKKALQAVKELASNKTYKDVRLNGL